MQIAALQRVMEELTLQHRSEIGIRNDYLHSTIQHTSSTAALHEQLQQSTAAGQEDYCDARIKLLQYQVSSSLTQSAMLKAMLQNRQEKLKLKRELKMQ